MMGTLMNYLSKGVGSLKGGAIIGGIAYAVFFVILLYKPSRRKLSLQNLYELMLFMWCGAILYITGVFPLDFSALTGFESMRSIGFVPFINSSILPIALNFLLFVPFGFLLSCAFPKKIRWYWALLSGFALSLSIETYQLFIGRYTEVEDVIVNALGALAGFGIFQCILAVRQGGKAFLQKAVPLVLCLALGFGGIYLVCDHPTWQESGLSGIMPRQIRMYHNGEWRIGDVQSNEYNMLTSQLNNCGGHILEPVPVAEADVWNETSYYMEVSFADEQTIAFEGADNFVIENADRLLYDTTDNILYWGNQAYAYSVDYTRLQDDLQVHKAEILEGYQELNLCVQQVFHKN